MLSWRMSRMKIIETDRLILRTWTDADLPHMYEINQDAQAMEYFSGLQDLEPTKKNHRQSKQPP